MNPSMLFQRLHSPTGHDLTTLRYKGQPCWLAQEIGQVLGYSANGSKLVNKITQDWSNELLNSEDFFKIEGEELAELREAMSHFATPESGAANPLNAKTRSLLLLTEQGVYLACIKSNKPAGVLLRRWLASEVLPALRRGEQLPGSTPPPIALELRHQDVQEARLWLSVARESFRLGALTAAEYAEALNQVAHHTRSVLAGKIRLLPQAQLALPGLTH